MKLTGKAKIDFEKWYNEYQTFDLGNVYIGFYSLDASFVYGVYVDWFDSEGIHISLHNAYRGCGERSVDTGWKYSNSEHSGYVFGINGSIESEFNARPEARAEAIKQANLIYNK